MIGEATSLPNCTAMLLIDGPDLTLKDVAAVCPARSPDLAGTQLPSPVSVHGRSLLQESKFPKGFEVMEVPSGKGYLRITPQPNID